MDLSIPEFLLHTIRIIKRESDNVLLEIEFKGHPTVYHDTESGAWRDISVEEGEFICGVNGITSHIRLIKLDIVLCKYN